MTDVKMKKLTPRQRGLYPEPGEAFSFEPRVELTIKMTEDVYEWLTQLVGRNSYFYSVEEAITTALRAMGAGRSPLDLTHLAALVAQEKGGYPTEVMFGTKPLDREKAYAIGALVYGAGLIANNGDEGDLPEAEEDRRAILDVLKSVKWELPKTPFDLDEDDFYVLDPA